METFRFGDPTGNVVALALISTIALLSGFAVYALLAYPSLRRGEYRRLGSISRRSAALIGAIPVVCIMVLAYPQYGLRFHQLDIQGDWLYLQYSCPSRTVMIRPADIEQLVKAMAGDKGNHWQLLIKTRGGKEYRSAGVNYHDLQTYLKRLEQLSNRI